MSTNRRTFLKSTALASLGVIAANVNGFGKTSVDSNPPSRPGAYEGTSVQRFNMCGYAAPKLDIVRVGFIGLGNRGPGHVVGLSRIDGVEIKALCDVRAEKITATQKRVGHLLGQPDLYSGSTDVWKNVCDRDDIDLVYISTPWDTHVEMAVYAMERGKHVAVEIPAAKTIEECWELVRASERTKRHCVILENCCYDFFELLTLNMARQGFFGEIVHCEGAYIHDILKGNFSKTKNYEQWRLKENYQRNGNLYPTHGLGPIAQVMNINRGDRFDYLSSFSSDDFMMGNLAKELAAGDSFYQPYVGKQYRGNMNVTTLRTVNGRTIMLQHDVTSPRPYSRLHIISGTRAFAQKYPLEPRISAGKHDFLSKEDYEQLVAQYIPRLVSEIGETAKKVGGHGGMDFLMNWRLIDCLRNGLPVDMDVYDAAAWSAIGPLSEWSVANRSNSIDVPDFTSGAWTDNKPVDLEKGAGWNTKIRLNS